MAYFARVLAVFVMVLAAYGPADAEGNKPEDRVLELLYAQQSAWNRGDIDAFMTGYWKNSDLTFVSGGTMLKGWDATLARYKANYSTRALMGQLRFEDIEVDLLAADVAMVKGIFRLTRDDGSVPWGRYTLILRLFDPEDGHGPLVWRIVYDHTSVGGE